VSLRSADVSSAGATAAPALEDALVIMALAGLGEGATVDELNARLQTVGLALATERVHQVLEGLRAGGSVVRHAGAGVYAPTHHGRARLHGRGVGIDAERAALERVRTELLGVVGHELRTPLTVIRTSVGLLQDPLVWPSPTEGKRLLANIAQAAERIQALVADVLDIARFRSGTVHLQCRSFDAAELAETVVDALMPSLAQKQQHVQLRIDDRPIVYGDRSRMRQVLVKLIGNAQRFSPAGTTITVSVGVQGDDVAWSVADSGPGIPTTELPRLFDRFFGPTTESTGAVGPGLGLPIAAAIARAHGGTIEVDSAPGSGSTFVLRVPLRGPEADGEG